MVVVAWEQILHGIWVLALRRLAAAVEHSCSSSSVVIYRSCRLHHLAKIFQLGYNTIRIPIYLHSLLPFFSWCFLCFPARILLGTVTVKFNPVIRTTLVRRVRVTTRPLIQSICIGSEHTSHQTSSKHNPSSTPSSHIHK